MYDTQIRYNNYNLAKQALLTYTYTLMRTRGYAGDGLTPDL